MSNANELLIRINADAKNAVKAFEDVQKRSEDLRGVLDKVSLAGAAVFAAVALEAKEATSAFIGGQRAALQLNNALQNQGIFSVQLRDHYKEIAEAVSKKTGIDDDEIVRAEAITQGYLGQTKVTEDLVKTIVDFGAKMGSTTEAAELIGRAIGTNTNALARHGVTFKEGSNEASRYKQVIEQLLPLSRGQAEADDKASLGLKSLNRAWEDLQKQIGEQVAPVVREVVHALTQLIDVVHEHPEVVKFGVAMAAGAAAAGLFLASLAPLAYAVSAVSAALAALEITAVGVAGVIGGIPLAIAAVVTAAIYLGMHWQETWGQIRAVTAAASAYLFDVLKGIGIIVAGAFHLDPKVIEAEFKRGWESIQNATKDGHAAYVAELKQHQAKVATQTKTHEEQQDATLKDMANKREAERKAKEAREKDARDAEAQLKLLELHQASDAEIKIAKEKVAILKDLVNEQNKAVIAAERARLQQERQLESETRANELKRTKDFEATKRATKKEAAKFGAREQDAIRDQELLALKKEQKTEDDVIRDTQTEIAQRRIAERNLELQDRIKYGATVAAIDKVLHSQEITAAKTVAGELVALGQSKNETLKAIGKAAAIAQITINTAESAVVLTKQIQDVVPFPFSIPVIGALVGARIAFGAEQIANVNAAADGALVGGTGNRDNQPFLLTPGELVTPKKNFNEVVAGVQTERSGIIDDVRNQLAALSKQSGKHVVVNISGDVLAENAFVDRLMYKIGQAVQFRNGQIAGITT